MKKLRNGLYAVLNSTSSDSSDYRIAKHLISNVILIQQTESPLFSSYHKQSVGIMSSGLSQQ